MYIGRRTGTFDEESIKSLPENMRGICGIIIAEGSALVHNIPQEVKWLYEMCGYRFIQVPEHSTLIEEGR